MTFMECVLLIALIIFFSIFKALSARYPFITIPWITVILNPDNFGGRKQRNEFILHLVAWVVLSILITWSIAFFVFEPIISFLLFSETPLETSVIVISLSIFMYLDFTKKARILGLKAKEEAFRREFKENEKKEEKELSVSYFSFLYSIYYLAPRIYVYLFMYFYKNSQAILDACGIYLVEKYGDETCLTFFKTHLKEKPNKNLEYVENMLEKSDTLRGKARIAMTGKILYAGYNATEKFILLSKNKYQTNNEEKQKQTITRKCRLVDRVRTHTPIIIKSLADERLINGYISNYSKNGEGLFFSTNQNMSVGDKVTIGTDNSEMNSRGEIIREDEHKKGFAIKINEKDRSSLLAILNV